MPSRPSRPSQSTADQSRGQPQSTDGSPPRGQKSPQNAEGDQAATQGQPQSDGQSERSAGTETADAGTPGDANTSETEAGDANRPGEDGWETSTELPQVPGSDVAGRQGDDASNSTGDEDAGGDEAGEDAQSGEQRDEGIAQAGEQGSEGGSETEEAGAAGGGSEQDEQDGGSGGELARALEDLDGEILAERIKAEQAARAVAGSDGAQTGGESEDAGTSQSGGGAMPSQRGVASATPATPRPPLPTPPDTPDARDDCVVARQIREAAMNETDPELRDALWKEYERYESCQ